MGRTILAAICGASALVASGSAQAATFILEGTLAGHVEASGAEGQNMADALALAFPAPWSLTFAAGPDVTSQNGTQYLYALSSFTASIGGEAFASGSDFSGEFYFDGPAPYSGVGVWFRATGDFVASAGGLERLTGYVELPGVSDPMTGAGLLAGAAPSFRLTLENLSAGGTVSYTNGTQGPFNPTPLTGASVTDELSPPPIGAVPEPGTWLLLLAGFGLMGAAIRSRRTKALGAF